VERRDGLFPTGANDKRFQRADEAAFTFADAPGLVARRNESGKRGTRISPENSSGAGRRTMVDASFMTWFSARLCAWPAIRRSLRQMSQ
jgi:hypothetical protein